MTLLAIPPDPPGLKRLRWSVLLIPSAFTLCEAPFGGGTGIHEPSFPTRQLQRLLTALGQAYGHKKDQATMKRTVRL